MSHPKDWCTPILQCGKCRRCPSPAAYSSDFLELPHTIFRYSQENIKLCHTKRSRFPTRMYLSIKSKIVSQQAVKVGEVRRSFKCWRKTFDSKLAALIRVSSIELGSWGEMLSITQCYYPSNYKTQKTYREVDLVRGKGLCGSTPPIVNHSKLEGLEQVVN